MKKILLATATLLSIYANAQEIENGTYIAKEKGQNIRLILKDNQYDLSLMSGKFEIKKDSIILKNQLQKKSSFNLTYNFSQSKLNKIKVNLKSNSYEISNIYISTYNGSSTPIYKRIGDVKVEEILDLKEQVYNNNLVFLIDRGDFLVLVKEDYLQVSEMAKFKIPEYVSEISVDVQNLPIENLKLAGIFNKETKELTISENGLNPLVFQPERQVEISEKEEIIPFETKKINNWNYPGKEITDSAKAAVDAAADAINSAVTDDEIKPKYLLKIENNLQKAIQENAKTPKKFLIVCYDPKNAKAKSEFIDFIKEQNTQINYNMYSDYDQQYDLFNYYLASKTDEKWLRSKKITSFPCVVAINLEGEILSQANKSIFELQNQFYYYDDFGKKINQTNNLLNFKKTISRRSSDLEVIKAFSVVSAMEIPYDLVDNAIVAAAEPVKLEDIKFVPPLIIKDIEPLKEEIKENVIEEVKVNPDSEILLEKTTEKADEPYVTETVYDEKPDYNTFTKVNTSL
jgi:hypothetical protein